MSVTFEKLMQWEPNTLSGGADQLQRVRKKFDGLQDEIDDGKPPATWIGDSGESARTRHTRLKLNVNDIHAPLATVIAGFDNAASQIRRAKEIAKSAHDEATSKGWKVEFGPGGSVQVTAPQVLATTHGAEKEPDPPSDATLQGYADEIQRGLKMASEAESELLAILQAAAQGKYDGGAGDIEDALPPEFGTILREGQEGNDKPDEGALRRFAQFIKEASDDPRRLETLLDQIGRNKLGNAMEDAAKVGVDLRGAMGDTGRDIVQGWVESDIKRADVGMGTAKLLTAYQDDVKFTNELFDDVTPAQFADAIEAANKEAFYDRNAAGRLEGIDRYDREAYSKFLHGAGAALATYSRNSDHPGELAQTWFESITKDDAEDAAALTLMIKKGGEEANFNTDFISSLTSKAYEWEIDHGGPEAWNTGGTGMFGHEEHGLLDPDGAKESKTFDYAQDQSYVTAAGTEDGLGNLLGGMAHSPGAAQRFFMEGYDDGQMTEGENTRLNYLLVDRDYDLYSLSGDNGDGLGLALEAACVGDRSGSEPVYGSSLSREEFSAKFTTDLMKTVAWQSGNDDTIHNDTFGFVDGNGWHTPQGLNDSLGAITAGYADDVYDILTPHAGADGTGLDISDREMKIVLGEMGHGPDKSGVEMLGAALVAEGDARIEAAIQQEQQNGSLSPRQLNNAIGDVISRQMKVTGGMLGDVAGYSGLIDAEDADLAAHRDAFIQKSISIGSGFIPGAGDMMGESVSKTVASGIDTATAQGIESLKHAVKNTDPATEWAGENGDALHRSLMNTYVKNGLLPDIPPEFTVDANGRVGGEPPVAVRSDITVAEDFQEVPGLSQEKKDQLQDSWTRYQQSSDGYKFFDVKALDGASEFRDQFDVTKDDVDSLAKMSHDERQKWMQG